MLTTRTHYRYVSGWCSSAMHQRCAGSYAGTSCCCNCHTELTGGHSAPAGQTTGPRP